VLILFNPDTGHSSLPVGHGKVFIRSIEGLFLSLGLVVLVESYLEVSWNVEAG